MISEIREESRLRVGDDVVLTVYGVAAPKGSRTTGRRRNGTLYTRPAAKGEAAFTEAVALAALQARSVHGTLPAPYSIAIEFFLPRPGRPSYGWPSRADVDKLSRGALDGLVRGGIIVDDRHVVELTAQKRFVEAGAEARTVIAVRTLPWCAS